MRVLLAPDSFKGCLSAQEVCDAIEKGIKKANPEIEIMQFPSSDGGEGFCNCMGNIFGGAKIKREVTYPLGEKGNAEYVYNRETKSAFIELASAAGLNLVADNKRDILRSSTFGVGELILDAVDIGAETIYIGLGGSATNDCGIGMLSALGMKFYDKNKKLLKPIPLSLGEVRYVDKTDLIDISKVRLIAACDVKNPLCGTNGAAKIFSKQKSATDEEIEILDFAASEFAKALKIDPMGEGYGAAGGVGGALIGVLGAEFISGAELLVSSPKFKNELRNIDLVITGEGNTDGQTACGKLISVIAVAAHNESVPVVVISGGLSEGYEALFDIGVKECHALCNDESQRDYSIKHAFRLLAEKAESVFKNLKDGC